MFTEQRNIFFDESFAKYGIHKNYSQGGFCSVVDQQSGITIKSFWQSKYTLWNIPVRILNCQPVKRSMHPRLQAICVLLISAGQIHMMINCSSCPLSEHHIPISRLTDQLLTQFLHLYNMGIILFEFEGSIRAMSTKYSIYCRLSKYCKHQG